MASLKLEDGKSLSGDTTVAMHKVGGDQSNDLGITVDYRKAEGAQELF